MSPQTVAFLPFVLSTISTLIVVMVGVLFNSHHVDTRISDLRAYMEGRLNGLDGRLNGFEAQMNQRFQTMDSLFQERLRRVEEVVDARLGRIEDQLNIR